MWSVAGAGRDAPLPVGGSKNSSGNIAEGKGRGLLGSWVGMPGPFLFLPGPLRGSPPGSQNSDLGRPRSPPPPQSSPLSPPTQAGPGGPELKKDCSVVTKPGDKVPEGGLISFLLFQRATSGLMRLLLRPWVLRAWELLGPDVVCLPESRLPGEEPPN